MHFITFCLFCISYGNFLTVVISYKTVIVDDDGDPYMPMPPPVLDPKEKDKTYWHGIAEDILKDKLSYRLNTNIAKNIIFFLGDGLSVATITAARIYEGQLKNKTGEEHKLYFENFPITGLSKTYCTDKQVADSASTATAYMSGVKSNYQTIGVTAEVTLGDCAAAKNPSNHVTSIVQWSQDANKATGIVTTTRVTHASPAGSYAHTSYRNLESDFNTILEDLDPNVCDEDIAEQLIYGKTGRNIKVIMGGGRVKFLPNNTKDPVLDSFGERQDGVNLIDIWKDDKRNKSARFTTAFTKDELFKVDAENTDYLLGLFAPNHLSYHLELHDNNEPTLSEMTNAAIKILQKEKNGFYLFVEGGKIDLAHHSNLAHLALDETVEFSKAVQTAAEMTNEDDTLIIVTADHSHVMTLNGYPARGTDILKYYGKDKNNLTYPTLSYANGPSYNKEIESGIHHDYTKDNTMAARYAYPALVPKKFESHGGDDVAVYARGPWAHLFAGNYEQHYIPIAEAYAANIGPRSIENKGNNVTILQHLCYLQLLCFAFYNINYLFFTSQY